MDSKTDSAVVETAVSDTSDTCKDMTDFCQNIGKFVYIHAITFWSVIIL